MEVPDLRDFRHPAVRDLAWAIGSPPLLVRAGGSAVWPDREWYDDAYAGYLPALRILDRNPAPLDAALRLTKSYRLGHYFERLVGFWVDTDPRFELLAEGVQIREAERTVGEIDLVLRDRESGRVLHWELAVKFYLGVGKTRHLRGWFGPERKDRLDLKVTHLLERQLPLIDHPATRNELSARGIVVDGGRVMMKGRLFYPNEPGAEAFPEGASSDHCRGRYFRTRELDLLSTVDVDGWILVPRSRRLAPLAGPECAAPVGLSDLGDLILRKLADGPVCVAGVKDGTERSRLYVVPDWW